MEFLRSMALARGWSSANGLPDETRAGRTILKDYTSGKLVSAEMPPGFEPESKMLMVGKLDDPQESCCMDFQIACYTDSST